MRAGAAAVHPRARQGLLHRGGAPVLPAHIRGEPARHAAGRMPERCERGGGAQGPRDVGEARQPPLVGAGRGAGRSPLGALGPRGGGPGADPRRRGERPAGLPGGRPAPARAVAAAEHLRALHGEGPLPGARGLPEPRLAPPHGLPLSRGAGPAARGHGQRERALPAAPGHGAPWGAPPRRLGHRHDLRVERARLREPDLREHVLAARDHQRQRVVHLHVAPEAPGAERERAGLGVSVPQLGGHQERPGGGPAHAPVRPDSEELPRWQQVRDPRVRARV
mmetsp:Transcript_14954/g.50417  ORF Transcript_14954/g.50417 Transcript_14954/m.50417 type:complete len:279 (-) Transcript_14954:544-1380(-)